MANLLEAQGNQGLLHPCLQHLLLQQDSLSLGCHRQLHQFPGVGFLLGQQLLHLEEILERQHLGLEGATLLLPQRRKLELANLRHRGVNLHTVGDFSPGKDGLLQVQLEGVAEIGQAVEYLELLVGNGNLHHPARSRICHGNGAKFPHSQGDPLDEGIGGVAAP